MIKSESCGSVAPIVAYSASAGSGFKVDVAQLSPAGTPGVLDVPLFCVKACQEDGVVQLSSAFTENSAFVRLEISVCNNCHRGRTVAEHEVSEGLTVAFGRNYV